MAKNDTVEAQVSETNLHPWMLEDRIRWVGWRIRELTIQDGKYIDQRGKWLLEEKAAGGRRLKPGDAVANYAVWLLKMRDGRSWHQIAYTFFPFATEEHIEGYESKLRRMFARVESNHPGSKKFRPQLLSPQDKLLLRGLAGSGSSLRLKPGDCVFV
jgi:hypothetical protein